MVAFLLLDCWLPAEFAVLSFARQPYPRGWPPRFYFDVAALPSYPARKAMMAQRMSRLKKIIVVASVAALSLGGAGVAFAYWTSTGTGSGAAATGTPSLFVITGQDPLDPAVTPGGPGQRVPFTVTNPGPATQYLSVVTVRIANADGSAWVPVEGCLAADYSVTLQTPPTYGQMVSGASVTNGIALVTMANTALNQDPCQGQAVPLYFTADPPIG